MNGLRRPPPQQRTLDCAGRAFSPANVTGGEASGKRRGSFRRRPQASPSPARTPQSPDITRARRPLPYVAARGSFALAFSAAGTGGKCRRHSGKCRQRRGGRAARKTGAQAQRHMEDMGRGRHAMSEGGGRHVHERGRRGSFRRRPQASPSPARTPQSPDITRARRPLPYVAARGSFALAFSAAGTGGKCRRHSGKCRQQRRRACGEEDRRHRPSATWKNMGRRPGRRRDNPRASREAGAAVCFFFCRGGRDNPRIIGQDNVDCGSPDNHVCDCRADGGAAVLFRPGRALFSQCRGQPPFLFPQTESAEGHEWPS